MSSEKLKLAAAHLERSIENMYDYLDSLGLVDKKVSIIHPDATGIDPATTKTHEVLTLAAVDIDAITLRVMSQQERLKKKQKRRTKSNVK